jgi:rhodanese-related sulfurtransferase
VKKTVLISAMAMLMANQLTAKSVQITEELASISIKENGKTVQIERIEDTKHRLTTSFSKTSRASPPFCIQPINIGKVETIGELELLTFLQQMQDESNNMILIDARTKDWTKKGSIPGAINLPFTMLKKESKYINNILKLLGAKKENNEWKFDNVPQLVIFSNGIWDAQATKAIENLISLGYPEEHLKYYRGGMQNWYILGLTTKQ